MNNPVLNFIDNLDYIRIPVQNTSYINIGISSYVSCKYKVLCNNGFKGTYASPTTDFSQGSTGTIFNVAPFDNLYTGDIRILPLEYDRRNIKSIALARVLGGGTTNTGDKFYIEDLSRFLSQFPNLYSIGLNYYTYGEEAAKATIKGDLALIPKYIKRVSLRNLHLKDLATNLVYNINLIPPDSELEWFKLGDGSTNYIMTISGDLVNLPSNIEFFKIIYSHPIGRFVYSGGKEWRSDFDSLQINSVLPTPDLDLLLNDLANSITVSKGGRLISLRGTRTSASDSAVTYLQGLGFTVTITA